MPDYGNLNTMDFNVSILSHEEIREFHDRAERIRSWPWEDWRERGCRELIRDYIDYDVDENFFETYLRLVSDENDINFMVGELTKIFEKREIADLLTLILIPDCVRELLLLIMSHPGMSPLLVLSSYCTDIKYNTEMIIHEVIKVYERRQGRHMLFLYGENYYSFE